MLFDYSAFNFDTFPICFPDVPKPVFLKQHDAILVMFPPFRSLNTGGQTVPATACVDCTGAAAGVVPTAEREGDLLLNRSV